MTRSTNHGFTIAELLVGIGVTSLLLALLLPAVQGARERSRQITCTARVKGMVEAAHAYYSANREFPDYWETTNEGLAAHVDLLPYLDQTPLSQTIVRPDSYKWRADPPPLGSNKEAAQTPVPAFVCPSDLLFPAGNNYRACVGVMPAASFQGVHIFGKFVWADGFFSARNFTEAEVRDGMSNTVMYSERITGDGDHGHYTPSRDIAAAGYLSYDEQIAMHEPEGAYYACSSLRGEPSGHYSSAGITWLRPSLGQVTYNHVLPPNSRIPDCTAGSTGEVLYGAISARSFHPGGVNVGMADGAVKFVSDSVDLDTWRAISTVKGKEIIDSF